LIILEYIYDDFLETFERVNADESAVSNGYSSEETSVVVLKVRMFFTSRAKVNIIGVLVILYSALLDLIYNSPSAMGDTLYNKINIVPTEPSGEERGEHLNAIISHHCAVLIDRVSSGHTS